MVNSHVVSYSGGIASWLTAKRVIEKYGSENVTLLFADTKMEDEDLYRFLQESVDQLKAKLVTIADGRTPWQVFEDVRFLGNSRIDPCSKILKRDLLDKWRKDNCKPETTITYFGIDWSELHRFERLTERNKPWICKAPLTEPPYLTKAQMIEEAKRCGLKPPRLYEMGFSHNNCGGFCIKAGQAHFALLLRTMPERYKYHEEQEQNIQESLGKPVTILRRQINNESVPISLKEFRKNLERQGDLFDKDEWGGCGCAID